MSEQASRHSAFTIADLLPYELVPVSLCFADERYQRPPDMVRVGSMAARPDRDLFDPIHAGKRSDGRYAVIDGMHRVLMAHRISLPKVPTIVHSGLTERQEAELFVKFQRERKALKPFDEYRARLFWREPIALGIDACLSAAGFVMHPRARDATHIGAVGSCDRIFGMGGAALFGEVLNQASVWHGDDKPIHGSVLEGLGVFIDLTRAAQQYDATRLHDVLTEHGMVTIHRRANEAVGAGGGGSASRRIFYARALKALYNKGIRGTKRVTVDFS